MFIEIPKGTIIKGIESIGQKDLILKEDLKVKIKAEISYEINDVELNCFLSHNDLSRLKRDFLIDLKANYNLYTGHDDEILTEGAQQIKYKMLELLEEREE